MIHKVGKLTDGREDGDNYEFRFTITKTPPKNVPALFKLIGRAVLTHMIDVARRKDAHTNLQSETDVEKRRRLDDKAEKIQQQKKIKPDENTIREHVAEENMTEGHVTKDITEDIIENKITMDGWMDENTMKDHLTEDHLTEDIIANIIENKEHTTMNGKSIQDNTTEDHVTKDIIENIIENKKHITMDENTMEDHMTEDHVTEDIIENIIENK